MVNIDQTDQDVTNVSKAIQITVENNGIGIDKNQLGRIFELFAKLTGVDITAGEGTGLSYCKKNVRNHKGNNGVRSEIDKGSTYVITLPVNH